VQCEWAPGAFDGFTKTCDKYISGPRATHSSVLELCDKFLEMVDKFDSENGTWPKEVFDYVQALGSAKALQHESHPSIFQAPLLTLLFTVVHAARVKDTKVSRKYKELIRQLIQAVRAFAKTRVLIFDVFVPEK